MTLDEYLSSGPPHEAPIVEAVLAHLRTLGALVIEPVSVGVLVKRRRTFVELRPLQRWESVWFGVPEKVSHPRIARTLRGSGSMTFHAVNVRSPDEVDDQLRDWLTAAYLAAG
jgi:hypothetical protein